MLGTLFRHEWKATWKVMTVLNAAVLVMILFGFLIIKAGDFPNFFKSDRFDGGDGVLYGMTLAGYATIFFAGLITLFVGAFIYFCARFYRNLYTDQGYLMHTLPVSPHELILSKMFVCIIWRIVGCIVLVIGGVGMASAFTGESFFEIIDTVLGYGDWFIYVIAHLFSFFIMIFYSTLMAYMSISVGQLAKKNKVLASIGAYIGFTVGTAVLSSSINMALFLTRSDTFFDRLDMSFENMQSMTTVTSALGEAALCALFYWITYYIMDKKLNLD